MDFFKDLQDIQHSFHRFASLLPQDGALIINNDIENLSAILVELLDNHALLGSKFLCECLHVAENGKQRGRCILAFLRISCS